MHIVIYHNLRMGGAKIQMQQICRRFRRKGCSVTVFKPKHFDDKHLHKNIFLNTYQQIYLSVINDYKMHKTILNTSPDIILIFPCHKVQSPFILTLLSSLHNVIYIFAERKREFYENTSKHSQGIVENTIKRFVRLPLMLFDQINCRSARNIISNSYFSKYILHKNYGQPSSVIWPCHKRIAATHIKLKRKEKGIISIGPTSIIKGTDLSIKQMAKSHKTLVNISYFNNESEYYKEIANKHNMKLEVISNASEVNKNKLLKQSDLGLVNMRNEPYGIGTVEMLDHQVFPIGLNQGGTSEIVQSGLNGLLYPESTELAKLIYNIIDCSKTICFINPIKQDWDYSFMKLLNHISRCSPSSS